jgi:hypothetical protein
VGQHFPQVRLLLPVLPLALGPAVLGLLTHTGSRVVGHSLCGVVAATIAGSAIPTLHQFVAAHPVQEIAAARAIAAREGPLVRIATCYPQMPRYLAAPIVYVHPPPTQAMTAANLFARIAAVADQQPEFLVLSRVTTPLPFDTVLAAAPAGFVVESVDEHVLVGRFAPSIAKWLEQAAATPINGNRLRLRVQTRIDVGMAGFMVRSQDGTVSLVPLASTSTRTFELEVPIPASTGELELTPCVVLLDGTMQRGAPLRLLPASGR